MPTPPVNWTSWGDTLTVTTNASNIKAAVLARATYTTGIGRAIEASSFLGEAIYASAAGVNGKAIMGTATNSNGQGIGVLGRTYGTAGTGVWGIATSSMGVGVFGESTNTRSTATSRAVGVYGKANSTYSYGVFAANSAPQGIAIRATSTLGTGVEGVSTSSTGVGVYGEASSTGGYSNSGAAGVHGKAWSEFIYGVLGTNSATNGIGITGEAMGHRGIGVQGFARGSTGLVGVYGANLATGNVYDRGVHGWASARSPNSALGASRGGRFEATGQNAIGAYGIAAGTRTTRSSGLAGVYGYVNSTYGYGVFSVGDFGGTGAKYFVQPHPTDAGRSVQFICLEGNESGTYFRGTAELVNGKAEIPIPEEWKLVTEAQGITVQVTPTDGPSVLFVPVKSRDRIVVKGSEDCTFDYFVNGVRRGFAEYEPFMPNSAYRPEIKGVPFGTQYPKALRDILVKNGILNADYTPNEATAARLGWKLKERGDVPVKERWWIPHEERQRLIRAELAQPVGRVVEAQRSVAIPEVEGP